MELVKLSRYRRKMRFSLILATFNGSDSIRICMESLLAQTFNNYEIIVVDQNPDRLTEDIVGSFDDDRIKYFHVEFKGLSRARNYALGIASGDYVLLIDDDAYYEENYLEIAEQNLKSIKNCILSGFIYDTVRNGEFARYKKIFEKKDLPLYMVLDTCPSAGLVIPRQELIDIGMFDERFGVGSKYPAAEETDILVRMMKTGGKVIYLSNLRLRHPVPVPESNLALTRKQYEYSYGIGAFYRKNIKNLRDALLFFAFVKRTMKEILRFFVYWNDRKNISSQIIGLIKGYRDYGRDNTI